MQTTYRRERFEDGIEEGRRLAALEYAESVSDTDVLPFSLDEEQYRAMDAVGLLRCYTARRDGVLVGYFLTAVTPKGMNSAVKQAMSVGWFVAPEVRNGLTGVKLLRFAERELQAEGVVYNGITIMESSHSAKRVLEASGYRNTEMIYTRALEAPCQR